MWLGVCVGALAAREESADRAGERGGGVGSEADEKEIENRMDEQ